MVNEITNDWISLHQEDWSFRDVRRAQIEQISLKLLGSTHDALCHFAEFDQP